MRFAVRRRVMNRRVVRGKQLTGNRVVVYRRLRGHEACPDHPFFDDFFDGTVPEVIKRLQQVLERAREMGYETVEVRLDVDYEDVDFYFRCGRPETDEEMNVREEKARKLKEAAEAREAKKRAAKEKKEREEYERLKKKFEVKP